MKTRRQAQSLGGRALPRLQPRRGFERPDVPVDKAADKPPGSLPWFSPKPFPPLPQKKAEPRRTQRPQRGGKSDRSAGRRQPRRGFERPDVPVDKAAQTTGSLRGLSVLRGLARNGRTSRRRAAFACLTLVSRVIGCRADKSGHFQNHEEHKGHKGVARATDQPGGSSPDAAVRAAGHSSRQGRGRPLAAFVAFVSFVV